MIFASAEEADKFMDLLRGPVEPLHPDLVAYREVTDAGFVVINHPLIASVMHFEAYNVIINMGYAQRREKLARARAERDFTSIVLVHEKYARLQALLDVADQIESDREFWQLARTIWLGSETISNELDAWRHIWSGGRRGRRAVMTRAEQRELAAKPETFTVWRGSNLRGYCEAGFSWTTDRAEALWFANRFCDVYKDRKPWLAKGVVRRRNVRALFQHGESEVVIDPERLESLDLRPAPRVRTHQPSLSKSFEIWKEKGAQKRP